ncbi:MAG: hypothetical protein K2G90_07665 [Muribaculaceae bacterium]|nr:hypothetical protein [Muribaculaceae bacterium]
MRFDKKGSMGEWLERRVDLYGVPEEIGHASKSDPIIEGFSFLIGG